MIRISAFFLIMGLFGSLGSRPRIVRQRLWFAKNVDRQFEINGAIILRRRHVTRTDIHLNGRKYKFGRTQLLVALFAHGDESILADGVIYMNVGPPLLAYRRFPAIFRPVLGQIVMAQEQAGFVYELPRSTLLLPFHGSHSKPPFAPELDS